MKQTINLKESIENKLKDREVISIKRSIWDRIKYNSFLGCCFGVICDQIAHAAYNPCKSINILLASQATLLLIYNTIINETIIKENPKMSFGRKISENFALFPSTGYALLVSCYSYELSQKIMPYIHQLLDIAR